MVLFLASVILGIVPMVVYALVVWRLDRWEREPFALLLAAFLWGAVPSIVFALVAQLLLGAVPTGAEGEEVSLMSELYEASLIAPLTEELVKGFGVLLIFVFFRREIDSVLDGLIYGSMVGFGFAAVENIFYFAGQADAGGLIVLFFLRAFIFGMLHALFTGLTGVGLALGRFSPNLLMKAVWPVLGLGAAMATHALHNYFATLGGGHLLLAILGIGCGLLWFAVTMALCLYHENRWVRIQLSEEVDLGVLYAEQALAAANFWSRSPLCRISHGIGKAWRRHRLLHEATELAYQKQKAIRHGGDPGESARIAALRERVRVLSREDPLVVSGRVQAGRRLPPPLPPLRRIPPPLPRRG
jgi:RsiW-degrading membrane proteinase PrsW (M82 family)